MTEYTDTPRDLKKRELEDRFKNLVFELTGWAPIIKVIELSDNRSQVGELKRKELEFRANMKAFMSIIDDIRRELDTPNKAIREPKKLD